LGDKGLKILQPSLIENTSIKKLNISHNNLTEDSGATLEQVLIENKALEELDLSWNGFYTGPGEHPCFNLILYKLIELQGNKRLCNGLQKNELISWLNLAWNGIGTGLAMRPITKYLRKTKVLEFLDLSWNRCELRQIVFFLISLILLA
jgi:Ran GTPase-activating protein (RanGAP) involved in mRNA processing and transport